MENHQEQNFSRLMKCHAAFLKSFFWSSKIFKDFINENFIIWKYKHLRFSVGAKDSTTP